MRGTVLFTQKNLPGQLPGKKLRKKKSLWQATHCLLLTYHKLDWNSLKTTAKRRKDREEYIVHSRLYSSSDKMEEIGYEQHPGTYELRGRSCSKHVDTRISIHVPTKQHQHPLSLYSLIVMCNNCSLQLYFFVVGGK